MPWYNKEQPTPFDNHPIEGMSFLDGDLLAAHYSAKWLRGKKYPLITFPSGLTRELLRSTPQRLAKINLVEQLELPYQGPAGKTWFGYPHIYRLARVYPLFGPLYDAWRTEHGTILQDRGSGRGFEVTYDLSGTRLVDITHYYTPELIDGISRAILPPLGSQRALGMRAIALVKFFAPSTNLVWYATEYDGEGIFYGLVKDLNLTLDTFFHFVLSTVAFSPEPVRQDHDFQPQTLADLFAQYERE